VVTNLTQIIAVPYDSGRRGERMGAGPLRLLDAGLVGRLEDAGYPAHVCMVETASTLWPTEINTAFDLARQIADRVREARGQGAFPLVLSGNCLPAALGAWSGSDDLSRVIWFDAHGDFNTPDTTISGFLDGMALATLTGHCWRALTATIGGFSPIPDTRVTLVGARDFDPLEARALADSGITLLSVHTLLGTASPGIARTGPTYVHVDLDVLDPSEGAMNGYVAPDGMSRSQLKEAMHAIVRRGQLRAASVTAFDPAVDSSGSSLDAALSVCVELARVAVTA
jgi:arginase